MRLLAFATISLLAAADLKPPRTEPQHFPVQARVGKLTIAAEYLVRGLPGDQEVFFSRDYLVVEVALFPDLGARETVRNTAFSLQLNKDKAGLMPAAPQMVAASLKYEDWTQRPRVEAGAGVGDGAIIVGRPQRSGRFPGDPTISQGPYPRPPQVETQTDRSGIERTKEAAHEAAVAYALPEEPLSRPVRGYLYFPYSGKTKSVKKAVLHFHGAQGEATLVLK